METASDQNYQGLSILVTGGAGFIGHHLVNRLINRGGKVSVIDNLSTGRKDNLDPKAGFYAIDIRSPEITEIFKKEKPDIVFHLAAQPIVESAYDNPRETIDVNVSGTVNILEACRQSDNLELLMVCSTDKAYGRSDNLPYTEETPLKGGHPYDVSKSAADLITQAYFKTYGLPVSITRFSNVFGPGDTNLSRIIPGVFESILEKKEFLIRSDGTMVREYTYVEDIVDGCVKISRNAGVCKGEAFNFGSKNIFSVIGIIEKIEQTLGLKVDYKILNKAKNEIPEQYLDWSKAKEKLGWQPRTSIEEGIKNSYDWYKKLFFYH